MTYDFVPRLLINDFFSVTVSSVVIYFISSTDLQLVFSVVTAMSRLFNSDSRTRKSQMFNGLESCLTFGPILRTESMAVLVLTTLCNIAWNFGHSRWVLQYITRVSTAAVVIADQHWLSLLKKSHF